MTLMSLLLALSACSTVHTAPSTEAIIPKQLIKPDAQPRIAIALGGGAAKGFAHIGVLKVLHSHGIIPDLVTGTSVGSFVGALYSSGINPYALQELAFDFDGSEVRDITLSRQGFIKGEKLQSFINQATNQQLIENFPIHFAAVTTNLATGEKVVIDSGDAGFAVRASSSVPNIFIPAERSGRRFVDGGLVSPVPVSVARELGAKIVIAVDISDRPQARDSINVLNMFDQTFNIISQRELNRELKRADIVIKPNVFQLNTLNIDNKHAFILEGERAAQAQIAEIKRLIGALK